VGAWGERQCAARVGDDSWLNRDHVGASRAGPRGTKEHTVGRTGGRAWLGRLVGPISLDDGPITLGNNRTSLFSADGSKH
jgi:hypothetical protein